MKPKLVEPIEQWLCKYASFTDEKLALPIALWAIGTHSFQMFDAFPYLVITSATKRSGKTRLSELVGFLSYETQNFSAMTASTMFHIIDEKFPTIIFDEAEVLSGENASTMRAVLNVGYRRGQFIPRMIGMKVREYPTYCPKVFVLIGDVYDTLRDRSIVITLKRGQPKEHFSYENAKTESLLLTDSIRKEKEETADRVLEVYQQTRLTFLGDRDEEIWRPLMAICSVVCPDRLRELNRLAVDLCAEKTAPARRFVDFADLETEADLDTYARKAIKDLLTIFKDSEKAVWSQEAVFRMHELDLSPWRKFRGDGLTVNSLADLLSRFGLHPVLVRKGKKKQGQGQQVQRGYRKDAVASACSDV